MKAEGTPFKVTLSVSPPLANMMEDPLLQERCARHIDLSLALAEKECQRTKDWPDVRFLSHMYRRLFADESEMERFLAEVTTPAWNLEQDRGRPFAEATVLRAGDAAVSFLVDEIGDVLRLDGVPFESPPPTLRGMARELIRGAYKLDGGLLLALDTARILNDMEQAQEIGGLR